MKNKGNTAIARMRIAIPPQMPTYIPKTYLGMLPLPFSTQSPFKAIGQVPEGGKVNVGKRLKGIRHGSFNLNSIKTNTIGSRKVNSKARGQSSSSGKANNNGKRAKVQNSKGVNGLKKKR